ncbi:MAG: SPOR domain-containing protein [Beijerinckiaceae bacterium]
MFERCVAICRSSIAVAGFAVTCFALMDLSATPASAWHRHHHHHHWPVAFHFVHRHARPGAAAADIAAIVVDGNSGRVLYARNETELRHPASITKVMTLYLLFEQLEKGRMRLETRIPISAHAALQAPTKLGLDEGDTISLTDAIKAVVTKSANDIAVAIAEAIGGDEEAFATMMTRKAHALGMTSTVYANASGLPNDEQVTTAHDLAILGRAVQERFPRYYHFFSTPVFYFDGVANRNHNRLLDRIEGMDGIKTGYTRSSGFNLLTSVKRDGHYIVAVVLGGQSASSRDRIMADLIEQEIDKAATTRTVPLVAENGAVERAAARIETANVRELPPTKPTAESKPLPEPRPAAKSLPLASEPVPPDPVQVASIGEQIPAARPRPAFVAATAKPGEDQRADANKTKRNALDGSTAHQATTSATPSSMRWVVGPAPVQEKADSVKLAKAELPRAESVVAADSGRPTAAKSGWMIQIGATDDVAKANDLLARAKAEGRGRLSTAQPFTEKVQKGAETLYRARFAGLAEDQADAACKTLKRSGFACFATKN